MAAKVVLFPGAIDRIIATDPRAENYVRSCAMRVMEASKAVFIAQNRTDNEWRTSETTPPKYIASFRLRKIRRVMGQEWHVVNDDPAWNMVEYGARAGGKTFVLRYRPLGRGLDIAGAGV